MKTATNRAMMTRIAPKANGGPGTTLCNNEQTLSYFLYILSYDTDAFTYHFLYYNLSVHTCYDAPEYYLITQNVHEESLCCEYNKITL